MEVNVVFKAAVVNSTFPSLHAGSATITHKIHLWDCRCNFKSSIVLKISACPIYNSVISLSDQLCGRYGHFSDYFILIIFPVFLSSKKWPSYFFRGITINAINSTKTMEWISNSYLFRQSFQGSSVNRTFHFINVKSVETTPPLTVLLIL